jgi:predicted Zn-dependent protease
MDETAGLRQIKDAIENLQEGEKAMVQKQYAKAEGFFDNALRQVPDDYAGLVMMSKCQLALNKPKRAEYYAEQAKRVYPAEAQAQHVSGIAKLGQDKYDAAYHDFNRYEKNAAWKPQYDFPESRCLRGHAK